MNVNWQDVRLARMWAEDQASQFGDDPLDLMEYKLLEMFQNRHASGARYHTAQDAEIAKERTALERKFFAEDFVAGDEDSF